jgi:hypothetical protein
MPDNQPKWTPGPWIALSCTGAKASPLQVVASAEIWVKGSKLIASGFQNLNPEATANLQLIAAAPELYAALKLYVEHFGDPLSVARKALLKANPARGKKPNEL